MRVRFAPAFFGVISAFINWNMGLGMSKSRKFYKQTHQSSCFQELLYMCIQHTVILTSLCKWRRPKWLFLLLNGTQYARGEGVSPSYIVSVALGQSGRLGDFFGNFPKVTEMAELLRLALGGEIYWFIISSLLRSNRSALRSGNWMESAWLTFIVKHSFYLFCILL